MYECFSYICQSCHTLQLDTRSSANALYLSGSQCLCCGLIITVQTKRRQLDDFLLSKIMDSDQVIGAISQPNARIHLSLGH